MSWYELASAAGESGHSSDLIFVIPGIGLEVTSVVTTMWVIMGLLILLGWLTTRSMQRLPEGRLQNIMEMVVEALLGLLEQVMDRKRAVQYLPLLGSFFLFIIVSNYSGLIPGAGEIKGFKAPTSHWGVTAGLAIVVFVAVQLNGIRKKGLKYFKHFAEPVMMAPLMIPLNILEEVVKPFSLSLRLAANIYGGEVVLMGLLMAIPYFLPITVLGLEVVFGFIQAFIFTVLAAVYIGSATSEESH
ncbi:MAG TPA: F0F1 ATP synthase subunit A [Firmicutes bacterium]|jgi:F-type H+-transporting ATPase subunit a|nr:F0F1 ATP synthase subunit A [Bacillota bacterium]